MPGKSENKSQQAAAAGGAAINMSLFIKNAMQLNKMFKLSICSSVENMAEVGLECDAWNTQTRRYRAIVICVVLSLFLGLIYGVCTIAENQILKRMKAEEFDDDDDETSQFKNQKTVHLRTVNACIGFTLALLNIGLEVFVDSV